MHNEAVTCVALTRDKTCKEVTNSEYDLLQGRVGGLAELGGLGCLYRQVDLELWGRMGLSKQSKHPGSVGTV